MGKAAGLNNIAKLLGVAAAGAALTPEEAQGAGLMTIMRRLKVGPEEARVIKEMAKDVMSQGEFDDKVRAIQAVRKMKTEDPAFLGSGIEKAVYDVDGLAVKEPIRPLQNYELQPDAIMPAATEASGFGAPTNVIRTSENQYQVQPVMRILDHEADKLHRSPIFDDLKREYSSEMATYMNVPVNSVEGRAARANAKRLEEEFGKRLKDLYKSELGVDISEADAIQSLRFRDNNALYSRAKRLENDINMQRNLSADDVHEGNIAFTESGEPKVIDTGFFDVGERGLTPEMIENTLRRFSGTKKEKEELRQYMSGFLENPATIQKAAAAAPVGYAMSDQGPQGIDLGEGFSGLMDALQAGAGATREAISGAMRGELPESEKLQQILQDPESAITSEQLAGEMGVPDRPYFDPQVPGQGMSVSEAQQEAGMEPLTMRDAAALGIEVTADPTNLIGAGLASKSGKIAKALGRSRRLRRMLGLPTERPAVSAMDEYTKVLGREFDPSKDVIVRDENLYYDQTPPLSDEAAMRRFRKIQERADRARAEELAKEEALKNYDPNEATAVLDPDEADLLKQEDLMKKLKGKD